MLYICGMEINVTYHLPDGEALDGFMIEKCKADVSVKGIAVESMRRVLAELSEITARDFARLAALSSFKSGDDSADNRVEARLREWVSLGSGLDGAALSSGVHPFSNQPE